MIHWNTPAIICTMAFCSIEDDFDYAQTRVEEQMNCIEAFEDDEFCPIMVYPMARCPGRRMCPAVISKADTSKPYHTPTQCPDCAGASQVEQGMCDRCLGHRLVPLEEPFVCDSCLFWKYDRCLCVCLKGRINRTNRPPVCIHFQKGVLYG